MINYKEKYEKALERAKGMYEKGMSPERIEYIFPELKESEDEKTRKDLIQHLEILRGWTPGDPSPIKIKEYYDAWIAWLEKQGEHKKHLELKAGHWYFCYQAYCERADILTVKEGETFKCEKDGIVKGLIIKEPEKYFREISTPSDKVEPKFKVGDWIVRENNVIEQIEKITDLPDNHYQYWTTDGSWFGNATEARLWTIQDAKDGDVLVAKIDEEPNDFIYIFKEYDQNLGFWSHCYLDAYINKFHEGIYHNNCNVGVPATKEQCDILFQKMKEAWYEWDADKKELKKVEQNAWSEEDEKIFDSIIEDVIPYGECPDYPTDEERKYFYEGNRKVNWLEALKKRMKGE